MVLDRFVRAWLEASKSKGMELGLDRVQAALEQLGRPDKSMSCIHVAGSNGKGSACAMLVAGLTQAGYRVGLFSSPHLTRIEERVRIQGRPISREQFNLALEQIKSLEIELTFFEITYLVSLISCKKQAVQIMILETGLGGRLDATRTAEVVGCLVTSVSMEHADILGDTLEKIAAEKAAIWRPGVPMLIRDPMIPSVRNAMREEAISARFVDVEPAGVMDEAGDLAEILCKMLGLEFERRPANWPGRMQLIPTEIPILLDGAHNQTGMARVMPEIEKILPQKWSLLFGTSPQEDMVEFLGPLFEVMLKNPPREIITTEPQKGRYPGEKQPIADVLHIEQPKDALARIDKNTDLILIIGSLYLCGNILETLGLDDDDSLNILS
jgi:dihydrofolate synthase / folylpolyglutamate synthase